MNSGRVRATIGCGVTVKTRYRSGHAGEPTWRGRARVLDELRILWMLKRALAFAVIGEAKFVDQGIADGPVVRQVPLLIAIAQDTSEAGHVCARELKVGDRLQDVVVVEIIISGKVLRRIDSMIKTEGRLVATSRLGGNRLDGVSVCCGRGNKLQQINRGGVHASERDLVVRKDIGIMNRICRRGGRQYRGGSNGIDG